MLCRLKCSEIESRKHLESAFIDVMNYSPQLKVAREQITVVHCEFIRSCISSFMRVCQNFLTNVQTKINACFLKHVSMARNSYMMKIIQLLLHLSNLL